jgi:hypothetical protein
MAQSELGGFFLLVVFSRALFFLSSLIFGFTVWMLGGQDFLLIGNSSWTMMKKMKGI